MHANPSKVTVRVEVVVEGGQAAPVVTTYEGVRPLPRALLIERPQPSPADTPVLLAGSMTLIEASGTSQLMLGHLPRLVWAKAFPTVYVDVSQHQTPDAGAVQDTPLSDGSWSFTQAKGNAVPGAAFDSTPHGPNNSTLLVWFDFGGSPPVFSVEGTPFHGFRAAGSGGFAPGWVKVASSRLPAATLHASFRGSAGDLGDVKLHWNGTSWVGMTQRCGGALLSLVWAEPNCHLLAAGPGVSFAVAGPPDSLDPFHWRASGTASGELAGPFEVVVTE
jgi:hypothetical protein